MQKPTLQLQIQPNDLNFCSFSYVQLWGYRQILSQFLHLNHEFRWRNWESLRHLYIPLSELLWGSNGTMCKKCLLYTIYSINDSCSIAQSCPTLCDPMDCSMPGFPVFYHLQDLAQTHVHWVSDAIHHLVFCCPLLLQLSIFPSIRVFSKWVGSSHQLAQVLKLQLQHHSFQWIFRIDFLRIDWLDLLAIQGTLNSLLQHHSSKALILWHSAFFMVLHSHPYMTTGKTIALTIWTFVGKVMSLLFNIFNICFLIFLINVSAV